MTDAVDEMGESGELLAIYLQDHRAGAAAGLQLMRRCRDRSGGELADTLAWMADQTDEDRRSLDKIMEDLDVREARLKTALSVVAERVGRLKLNGHLWKRSPLSPLMELEALAAAVVTKRNLWRSLRSISGQSDLFDSSALTRLEARATEQLERIEAHHGDTARRAFAAPNGPTADSEHR